MIPGPIVADSTNDGRAQATKIMFENFESFTIAIAGNDSPSILHELGEVSRFTAWCRARVEDSFFSLRIQQVAADCCTRILNVAVARSERGGWRSIEFYKIRVGR